MNPLEKIKLGKPYKSGPRASTDLHAGGIFFCTPYEEIITFFEDGVVEISSSVIEFFRPMDGQAEIDKINEFKLVGNYLLPAREYIECQFENLVMVGLPLNENPEILTFHCSSKTASHQYSAAYKLDFV
ncbi:hypothetical protein [Haliscomenobacter sp.]|uniref:hypothetical protein n=1 Tax=Haliscomenobacter sp. TaxID=2717303 RepID=UPI003364CBA9